MSLPNEADFALVKMGDGEAPEVFTTICGLTDVTINFSAASNDRFVSDCAKPGEVPFRKQQITGKSLDVSGSGLSNVDTVADFQAALGVLKNYHVELYRADGTDAGELLGTLAMASHMTAANLSIPRDTPASGDITLPSHGSWVWTPEA
jgi:hypothetical protein